MGLVGPNGSGKTTTIRMLLDIIRPDEGQVSVFGADLTAQATEQIGYLPEERGLYRGLRVIPTLLYLAQLKGMSREDALSRIGEVLPRLGLEPHKTKKVRELSRGLAQLVQLAATIIHRPRFLVLDEPFSGLDPVNVRLIKDFISELSGESVAIMLSTHQMTDVEELCDRVVMINKGLRGSGRQAGSDKTPVRQRRAFRRKPAGPGESGRGGRVEAAWRGLRPPSGRRPDAGRCA